MNYLVGNSFKFSRYLLFLEISLCSRPDIHGLFQGGLLAFWSPTGYIHWEKVAGDKRAGRDRDHGIYILRSLLAGFRFGSMCVILLEGSLC